MRITTDMTTNRILQNINRNASVVDKLNSRLTTGKKILYPSDNPIIASRALKFRTNISETEQYARNAAQGISWMEITERGFVNLTDLLQSIRQLAVQGTSDTLALADRQSIITNIRSLLDQAGAEMNVSYAGRYVFSGFRTNFPPVIESESAAVDYTITQAIAPGNVEATTAALKIDALSGLPDETAPPQVFSVYRIKLPYTNEFNGLDVFSVDIGGTVYAAVPKSLAADADAYAPADNGINVIMETGELILGRDASNDVNLNAGSDILVNYGITALNRGDLNPLVYFECTDNTGASAGPAAPPNPKAYSMSNQELEFAFGTRTNIRVNSLAKDVFTPELYADLKSLSRDLAADVVSLTDATLLEDRLRMDNPGLTDEEYAAMADAQLREETKKYTALLHGRFSNILGEIDKTYSPDISREYTTLGSRMTRLGLIRDRLEDDTVSYTKLMSDNENADYLEAIMRLNAAQAVYVASMRSGAAIMQITLSDFIR